MFYINCIKSNLMPIEIKMPALSPTMTEGNLVKWLKKEGDKIKSGDVIAEIETDKATMELESSNSGTLGKIIIQEGAEGIKVNTLIALMLKNGEDKSALESFELKESAPKVEEKKEEQISKPEVISLEISQTSEVEQNSQRVFASPLAKRIAENNNINLATLEGSGPNGRIIKQDVEGVKQQPKTSVVNALGRKEDSSLPLTNIRKVIAKRLLESKTQVPHFYLSVDVNMAKLLAFRLEVNKNLQNAGIKISVNDLIIKASSFALRDFPNVNASFSESHITMYGNVDISVAVSTETGLITPIVKNADIKSISQISTEMKELAQKAKTNKLKPEEFQGGSFSISNLGMFGIKNFNAIVNPPQSAILAIGGTEKKPVFNEQLNQFIPMDIMNITLSADHRIVDGVLGAEFLNKIKFYLENPVMFSV